MEKMYQKADWKSEKHVPVIKAPDVVKKGELVKIGVTVGEEIAHPNTTEHHIRWVEVFFLPVNEKFPYHLGKTTFSAHGESVQGPNTSTVYTHHATELTFKTDKPGTIIATSYCNIHGFWSNEKPLAVV